MGGMPNNVPFTGEVDLPREAKHLKMPRWMREAAGRRPNGQLRSKMRVAWFFRFIETGDMKQSAIDVGYKRDRVNGAVRALKFEFAHLLAHAGKFERLWAEPLALAFHREMMDKGLKILKGEDEMEDKVAASFLGLAGKSADSILDRGDMSRGLALQGIDTGPEQVVGMIEGGDTFGIIRALVENAGIDAVRHMPMVMNHARYRAYVEETWPIKMVEGK